MSAKRPSTWGPDGLALIRAGQRAHAILGDGDAEMIGPEPRQPFGKTDLGAERGINADFGFVAIILLKSGGGRIGPRGIGRACRCGLLRHGRSVG
jgi:hypothetical protein